MSVQTLQRVFSPFRLKEVEVTPRQAEVLRRVNHSLDLWQQAQQERQRLMGGSGSGVALLDDLQSLDEVLAGYASWCASNQNHPDPEKAISHLLRFDLQDMSKRAEGYPKLQQYVDEALGLRNAVIACLRNGAM